jgi:imidazole glycerol-phosphate synthase subunit HisH
MGQPKVEIVDYGMGNLLSIERAVRHMGGHADITSDPAKIAKADRVILPGVGAFANAMDELRRLGMLGSFQQFLDRGRPLLGICLGMQLLFGRSQEFGLHEGLNLVAGEVVRLRDPEDQGQRFKIPHIGWAEILPAAGDQDSPSPQDGAWEGTMLEGVAPGSQFYFVHSYVCVPRHSEVNLAISCYGRDRFCSVVHRDNVWGCQFHPEKSGRQGLVIYRNFLNM